MELNVNLADVVRTSARRQPTAVAIVEGSRTLAWEQFDAQVDALAAGLVAEGIRRSDRVGLMQGNTTAFVVSYFAVLRAGGVAVPLNPALSAAEVAVLLADSGARLIICDDRRAQTCAEAAQAVGTCDVLVVGSGEWRAVLVNGERTALVESHTPADALAVIMYTPGTGARPKGAMLTHGALRANVDMVIGLDAPAAVRADDVVLVVVPTFHIYGLNAVLTPALAVGARVVLLDEFTAEGALSVVRDQHVSVVAGTPAMFLAWTRLAELGAGLATMRLFTSGGSPLPAAVLHEFAQRCGVGIYEGYGMTEAGPVIATTLVTGRAKAGSVGRPLPGVELVLRDARGEPVAEGDPGEVWVRSPSLFAGYWPHAAGGPDAQGWLRSGDVAFWDAEQDLHIVDRRREVIIVNGFTVYPREIESVIEAMPGVAEVAVVAVPDERMGESIAALVVPESSTTLSAEQVLQFCAQRLARFKLPATVRIVAALPHSAAGKVAKGRLREVYGPEPQAHA